MKQKSLYFLAYLSLLISYAIFVSMVLVDSNMSFILLFIAGPFITFYHKYKPISFDELIFRYTGISFPSWQSISHALQKLIGTDPEILKKESGIDTKSQTYEDYKNKK